jgi:hypothetical protein
LTSTGIHFIQTTGINLIRFAQNQASYSQNRLGRERTKLLTMDDDDDDYNPREYIYTEGGRRFKFTCQMLKVMQRESWFLFCLVACILSTSNYSFASLPVNHRCGQ